MKGRKTSDGLFRYDRELFDPVSEGTELATKQRVVLSPLIATDLSLEELRARFGYNIEGVTPLRAIVPITQRVEPHGAMCVEVLPRGTSLVDKPAPAARRLGIASELTQIVARAHEQRVVLAGLRPDLVFVGSAITVVPRWAKFLELRSKRLKYIDDYFSEPSPADRFYDLTLGRRDDPRVDIYLLGLLISWLWTDQHALDEDDNRLPWPGPAQLDPLVAAMISRDPDRRPSIDQVIATLGA